jgi:putative RNA 2'-phosphotransferase
MTYPPQHLAATSKFLSLVLRHQPQTIGLTLDASGWAAVDELIAQSALARRPLTRPLIEEVVRTNDKKRFALSDDGSRIRANQGHSIDVDLGLGAIEPPARLYHGTALRFLDSILASGLDKRQRHHVHLSESTSTAMAVGARYGAPVLLEINAGAMFRDGCTFFQAQNNVWLTDQVAPQYLSVVQPESAR